MKINTIKENDLYTETRTLLQQYYKYNHLKNTLHQRINYLTCRLWGVEFLRDTQKLVSKGAFLATVKSLTLGKKIWDIPASKETDLEKQPINRPYVSIKQINEALNLITELRTQYDETKNMRNNIKLDAIQKIVALHDTGIPYPEMIREWKIPGFNYNTVINWVYHTPNLVTGNET